MNAGTLRLAGRHVHLDGELALLEPHLGRMFGHAWSPGRRTGAIGHVHVARGVAPRRPERPLVEMFLDRPIWGELRGSALRLSDGRATAVVSYSTSRIDVTFHEDTPSARYAVGHHLLPIGVGEVLRTAGVYYIHAAAIVAPGGGDLIVGDSGAGKSTLCYQVIRAGLSCVADDGVLLTQADRQLRAYPYHREFSLDPAQLDPAREDRVTEIEPMRGGRRFRVELPSAAWTESATVDRVLFIRRGDPPSRLEPCGPAEALALLAEQNRLMMVYPPLASEHLRFVARLLQEARLAKLTVSSDLLDGPGPVLRLLE